MPLAFTQEDFLVCLYLLSYSIVLMSLGRVVAHILRKLYSKGEHFMLLSFGAISKINNTKICPINS